VILGEGKKLEIMINVKGKPISISPITPENDETFDTINKIFASDKKN
jgi:hypothetical protein